MPFKKKLVEKIFNIKRYLTREACEKDMTEMVNIKHWKIENFTPVVNHVFEENDGIQFVVLYTQEVKK